MNFFIKLFLISLVFNLDSLAYGKNEQVNNTNKKMENWKINNESNSFDYKMENKTSKTTTQLEPETNELVISLSDNLAEESDEYPLTSKSSFADFTTENDDKPFNFGNYEESDEQQYEEQRDNQNNDVDGDEYEKDEDETDDAEQDLDKPEKYLNSGFKYLVQSFARTLDKIKSIRNLVKDNDAENDTITISEEISIESKPEEYENENNESNENLIEQTNIKNSEAKTKAAESKILINSDELTANDCWNNYLNAISIFNRFSLVFASMGLSMLITVAIVRIFLKRTANRLQKIDVYEKV